MHQVSFEPTIPVFERTKTVHALDRASTVTGSCPSMDMQLATMLVKPNMASRKK
jgi:hypothetical protein